MSPFKTREFKRACEKKGFRVERSTGHDYLYFYYENKKTQIFTKVSFGSSEEIGVQLFKYLKKQLRLDDSKQLADFIKCPIEYVDYVEILRQKGII